MPHSTPGTLILNKDTLYMVISSYFYVRISYSKVLSNDSCHHF